MKRVLHIPIQYWIILFLTASTLFVYWPVQGHGFLLYDDQQYIVNNYYLQPGVTWENVVWALTTGFEGNWQPPTWISHMLDYQFFKLNPAGHHLHNVLLHLLNSLLLYLILRRLTNREGPSAFVAFVFALHPLHVESVAWVSERKDVLSAFFGILTIGAYGSYVASPAVKRYLVVILCFALGLMAKPMIVTLPFVLLLLDYWPLNRLAAHSVSDSPKLSWTYLLLEKAPLFVLSLGSSVITYNVQQRAEAVTALEVLPLSDRMLNALVSYLIYMKKMFWPVDLAIFYPHSGNALPVPLIVISGTVLVALTGIVVARAKRYPALIVGWFWYLGTLVPMIGIVQIGAKALADRYMYLPMIGLTIMVAWFIADATKRWRVRRFVLGAAGFLYCVVCVAFSVRQVGYWKNDRALFERALSVTEKNWLAHYSLGIVSEQEGDFAGAQYQYEQSLVFYPGFAVGHFALGEVLLKTGDPEGSIPHFQYVLEKGAEKVKAHMNLGVALATLGKPEEALGHFDAAFAANRFYGEPHHNVAMILAGLERYDEALDYLLQAQRIQPTDSLLVADMERVRKLKKESLPAPR